MTTTTPQVPIKFLPNGTVPLETQVAGHKFQAGTDTIGMLKSENDGTVLKPLGKPICGAREIRFYETLQQTIDPFLITLKDLVPQYHGVVTMQICGREEDFIKLTDLTYKMYEPCIIDIKIGKRTWDPLATAEKIAAEEEKYAECKKNLGLCIPGFQVNCLQTGKLRRFGRDYGKQLNVKTFKDALRIFLNSDYGLCRSLIMQILSQLWTIQKWARSQNVMKLYSSSILIVYDARRLKTSLQMTRKNSNNSNGSLSNVQNKIPSDLINRKNSQTMTTTTNWSQSEQVPIYKKVQRSHSAQNNYDEDLKLIRENYVYMLDNLIDGCNDNKEWARVKMIDFAHAFPSNENSIDTNYLFGIENLVKIFEEFLQESN